MRVFGFRVCLSMALFLSAATARAQETRWTPLKAEVEELYQHGEYEKAIPVAMQAVQVAESTFGATDPKYAEALNDLAFLYEKKSRYTEAEPLFLRALKIREDAFGERDPLVARSLGMLAQVYEAETRYSDAEKNFERAVAIDEKALGFEHPDVATLLGNFAEVYIDEGKYAEAEPMLLRALKIDQKTLGSETAGVAADLNNLAELYDAQARYADEAPLLKEALRIDRRVYGAAHPIVAKALNNLAEFYESQGKYRDAGPLFQQSLAMAEKMFGSDDPEVAVSLVNLGMMLAHQGSYDDAEGLLLRAVKIDQAKLGTDSLSLAVDLNDLGEVLADQGKLADAQLLLKRSLQIREKVLDSNSHEIATVLNNIGSTYEDDGNFAEAEPLFRRALEIDEKALAPEQVILATDLNNLGQALQGQGRYEVAEPMLRRAIEIQEKGLGPGHPALAQSLINLAELYDAQSRPADAQPLLQRAFDNLFDQFQYNFTYMTEKDRLDFLNTVKDDFAVYFSFVYRYYQQLPELTGSMYNLVLWQKSFVAESIAVMRRQIEASGNQEALRHLGELTAKRTQLAALLNTAPADQNIWRKQVSQLLADTDALEKKLVSESEAFAGKQKLKRANWKDVRDTLKQGEAAVEVVQFQLFDKAWKDERYYVALVITRNTKDVPRLVMLGTGAEIEGEALKSFEHSVQTRGLATEESTSLPGARAYDLIWKPLDMALEGHSRIYLAPDGMLNQIPLGIIPSPDGKLQMERYDLRTVNTTRDLLQTSHSSQSRVALLVGDPDFALGSRVVAQRQQLQKQEEAVATSLPRLPGTSAEVDAVAQIMDQAGWAVKKYERAEARKGIVTQVVNPRVVHLATHGFFRSDEPIGKNTSANRKPFGLVEDPMLRSGLYFAGADRSLVGAVPANEDNGVLTALEASNLNLEDTELVVLSACDTGRGEVQNGEGVFGLRRAFQEAGAQAVVLSLWSVPDKETLTLMRSFYQKWLAGEEKHQALKEAQLEIRAAVMQAHGGQDLPYYWGAFVLVGR